MDSKAIITWVFGLLAIIAITPYANAESDNYGSDKLLPGETVVTPTGQTIKVWSTEGPVKVSPPPDPFDDPSKQHLDQGGVVVDMRPQNVPEGHDSGNNKRNFKPRSDKFVIPQE
jgi:hypothetical protein